jgi:hypothetical protein
MKDGPKPRFFAYVISDGDHDKVSTTRAELKGLATTLDVTARRDQERLVHDIRRVGQSAVYVH